MRVINSFISIFVILILSNSYVYAIPVAFSATGDVYANSEVGMVPFQLMMQVDSEAIPFDSKLDRGSDANHNRFIWAVAKPAAAQAR